MHAVPAVTDVRIELDDVAVTVPVPDGWHALDLDGGRWLDGVAVAVEPWSDVVADADEFQAWVAAVVGDAVRDVLDGVEPALTLLGIDDAGGAPLVVVTALSILSRGLQLDDLLRESRTSFERAEADAGSPVAIDRADLADRTLVRQLSATAPEPGGPTSTMATVLVEVPAAGLLAVVAGAAVGPAIDAVLDVWCDLAARLQVVALATSAAP